MKYKGRVVLSVAVAAALIVINSVMITVSPLVAGNLAGLQFDSSTSSYVISHYGSAFFTGNGLGLIWLLAAFAIIWWKPVKSILIPCLLMAATFSCVPQPVAAYYDKTDYAEPYFILPNESAFWVPDVGDNKASQAKFGSAEYFEANKIAAKRFVIPHTKLENSGLFSNFYVPAGRLIIVNRAPVSLEWVADPKKGSAPANESFPCQSKEGLNITVGMAIGVSVLEENSAKYLYRFGVAPLKGNRDDPNITFQSVLHSRSLFDVMTHVGRNKVQALVCNEMTKRSFDDANSQALNVMQSVKDDATKYFESVGITLDYLGWADTMTFDKDVQEAINHRYTNEKLRPVLDVMMTKAQIDTMQKWNGVVPPISGLWVLPHDVLTAITNWFSSSAKSAAK